MYAIVVATNIGIFVLLALSLNIIAGYAGQSSIGHAAFFGIGAYTSAVLTSTLGVNFWLSLPIAFVVTGLIGALLGLASMRVKEEFFSDHDHRHKLCCCCHFSVCANFWRFTRNVRLQA